MNDKTDDSSKSSFDLNVYIKYFLHSDSAHNNCGKICSVYF